MNNNEVPPILARKVYGAASVFTPESLLREARRQKAAAMELVPEICLLDPDGDIVRQLQALGRARRHAGWVCYHTDLHVFEIDGLTVGVVGCAVGSSFAVLVAEELFASLVSRNGASVVQVAPRKTWMSESSNAPSSALISSAGAWLYGAGAT